MKAVAYSLLALFSLSLVSCGSSSGVDPHLSLEEQQEVTEINLVGKWKIRRPQPIGTSNKIVFPADCNIDEIEFFDEGDYILAVSILDSEGEETSKIFRGKYDLLFVENGDDLLLEKIVLMEQNYVSSSNFPAVGSIATIDQIELTETDVSFRIQLGEGTNEFCNTGQAIELSGDKEEQVAPEAEEDSNHFLIQNEWRITSVTISSDNPDTPTEGEILCELFESEYFDRCYDEATGEPSTSCPQATTVTLLISGYGTYLFSYYDFNDNLLSTEQGDWRWRTDTTEEYTVFEVKSPDDTFEESDIRINVIQVSEVALQLSETQNDPDYGEQTIVYSLQLASLPYRATECGDFTNYNAGGN
ncbi:MAG: hypothetical protein L7U68_02105 [Flavobacteriaceae bacterium]|nr:hypothetical protein [Flavobacteriaceae bacterium]